MAMWSSPFTRNIFCMPTLFLALVFSVLWPSNAQLQVGFYSTTCPDAEDIVSSVVSNAVSEDSTVAAALLRLHFHDCFVQGCDASILVDKPNAENKAFNHAGVRGFDVIERAKTQLEETCQGVVSCADIIALAARDSVALSNGPSYEVPTGRRDGLRSDISDADNMPVIQDTVEQLKTKFMDLGLSEKDLVVLTGAHTIGTTACFFLQKRLYDFVPGGGPDPLINPEFLPELNFKCPKNGDVNVRVGLDPGSDLTFDDQILRNIRSGSGVLETDARLYEDESTKRIIDSYFGLLSGIFGPSFESDFAESMVKMGQIGATPGGGGEIRRVCSAFN